MAELHPNIEPLSWLLGTWRGRGKGHYPTIDPFEYLEVVVFGHVGKPFISYAQKTSDPSSGMPLHAECGYLRADADGGLELVLSQPSGIVEVHEGTLTEQIIELKSTAVLTSATAKSVTEVTRTMRVSGDELSYEVSMAAVGQPLQHHIAATLERIHAPT